MTTNTTTTESSETTLNTGYKIFIGNLSFKTTKESLLAFAEPSGKVIEVTIATRGRRALGYGFIIYSTEAEAKKAVTELNTKELDGRVVYIEDIRPKSTEEQVKKTPGRKPVKKSNKARQIKLAKKATRPTEPSKTTLFVANLPYATTDNDLKTLFKDYSLVSAKVSRMKNGCSKGYGFVEFETEQDQIKAFESVKDINLEGRAVYLKIALSEQNRVTFEDKSLEEKVVSLEIKDTK